MTNFRLFQTKRLCRRQFQILITVAESSSKGYKTLWKKEKLLVTSNFSYSHSVFKRLVLQTRKNQGLFGKELKDQVPHFQMSFKSLDASLHEIGGGNMSAVPKFLRLISRLNGCCLLAGIYFLATLQRRLFPLIGHEPALVLLNNL